MERQKQFMIDIESTGVSPEDDILEIGIVEMDFSEGFWHHGRSFSQVVHSPAYPVSAFAIEHMVTVYERSRQVEKLHPEVIRDRIVNFFKSCGKSGHEVLLCGWNASNFDVPMLHWKQFLRPPGYVTRDGKDLRVGDHHYRVYEMCGAIQLASDVIQEPYESFKERAKKECPIELPVGLKQHDALYDCYQQIGILNGLIKILRAKVGEVVKELDGVDIRWHDLYQHLNAARSNYRSIKKTEAKDGNEASAEYASGWEDACAHVMEWVEVNAYGMHMGWG